MKNNKFKNIFTVDLEDWFAAEGFEEYYEKSDKDFVVNNLINNTRYILELLKRHDTKATFFVLGKLAEMLPELVNEISKEGHEIASHGYNHKVLYNMTDAEFDDDIKKSIIAIENTCGIKPMGYRAPQFSINRDNIHFIDILKDNGFLYDSSIYPTSLHPNYGFANAPTQPYYHPNGIAEFPIASAKILNFNIPCGGGAYLRFYPYLLFKKLFFICNKSNGTSVLYIHPWEFSHTIPKGSISKNLWIRQHYNISGLKNKMEGLIYDFKFTSVLETLKEMKSGENIN